MRTFSNNPFNLVSLEDNERLGLALDVVVDPATPPEVLRSLLESTNHYWIKQYAARNPSCPTDILAKLAKERDWVTRVNVAENKSSPAEVLVSLVNDPEGMVRQMLCWNRNLPIKELEKLSRDLDSDVSEVAQYKLKERKKGGHDET